MAEKGARWFALGLLIVGALAVYGVWNKPEQMRPLSYDKGVYGGPEDTGLGEDMVDNLRERTRWQGAGGL